jgi:hypothetical protein
LERRREEKRRNVRQTMIKKEQTERYLGNETSPEERGNGTKKKGRTKRNQYEKKNQKKKEHTCKDATRPSPSFVDIKREARKQKESGSARRLAVRSPPCVKSFIF